MIAQTNLAADAVFCPRCQLTAEPAQLTSSGGVAIAQCGRCGHHFGVGNRVKARPALRLVTPLEQRATPGANPFSPPGTCCPKCAVQKKSLLNCVSCGADFAKLEVNSLQPPRWLRDRWVSVWASWDDLAGHEALLAEAVSRDALPALARLYRVRLAWSPKEPVATACLAEVTRRATLPLLQHFRADLAPRRRRMFLAAVVVLSGMLLVVLRGMMISG